MVPSLGQNRARYSRLSDDMLRIIPEATPDIREAAYLNVREHAGTWTYYLTYSIGDTNDPDYRVAYAAASTMEGDGSQWTYRGEILVANERLGILGTGHHCILRVPGTDEWVIAYHCFLPDACARAAWTGTRAGASAPATSAKSGSPDSNSTNGADGVPLIRPVTVSMSSLAWS